LFNWKHQLVIHPGTISNKKKESIKYLVSYDRECIQKVQFLEFVRIFRLSCVIVPIFFPENFSKTITNKTKKELCISTVPILSYGLKFIQKSHRKKHFQFFPNFAIFRATFPILLSLETLFGLLRTFKKKLPNRSSRSQKKQHFIFIYIEDRRLDLPNNFFTFTLLQKLLKF
jgi:hypothetical protein